MSTAAPRSLVLWRTLESVALAAWVGGLIAIVAAVIPAVFNSFGMEAGGRFLTLVFEGYNRVVMAAALLLLAGWGWRAWRARRGDSRARPTRMETLLIASMIGIAAVIGLVLEPRTVALQQEAFAAQEASAKKAAYDAFFRSHHIVRGLYVVNLALGIALLGVKARHGIQEAS